MRRRKFLLVHNPAAGRNRRRLLDAVIARVQAHDRDATFTQCIGANAADLASSFERASRDGDIDAIVAAGGDGTMRLAAAALLQPTSRLSGVPIGFVPLGTGNVLAHELALPRGPALLAEMLCHGQTQDIQAASANGEPFLLMAGAGFDGEIVSRLNQASKSRFGKLGYAVPLARALASPLPQLTVVVDGQQHTAAWTVIANARHYGGAFRIAPQTSIEAAGLSCILFKSPRRDVLLAQMLALATGRLEARIGRGDVAMIPCRDVRVEGPAGTHVQIDGDAFGTLPLDVRAGIGQVRLLRPS